MPLDKLPVSLPIVGGLNQKLDSVLSQNPQKLTNCVYRKTGSLEKRFGHEQIAPNSLRSDGTTVPACEVLTTAGESLVRIGQGQLDEVNILGSSSSWMNRGRVSEAIAREDLIAGFLKVDGMSSPDVTYCNGHIVAAYRIQDDVTVAYTIHVDVTNATTGAKSFARYTLASVSAGATISVVQVATVGNSAGVFWVRLIGSTYVIEGRILNTATMTWSSVSTVQSGIAGPVSGDYSAFAVDGSANAFFFVYELASAGANAVRVKAIDTSFATVYSALSFTSSTTDVCAFAIKYVAGERVWVAFSNGSADTYLAVASLTNTQQLNSTLVSPGTYGGIPLSVTVERVTSTKAIVITSYTNGTNTWYTEWDECTSAGVLSYAPNRFLWNTLLSTKAFVVNGRVYAWCHNHHETHTSVFLLDFYAAEALPATLPCRLVATALPRYGLRGQLTSVTTLSSVVNVGTDQYYGAVCMLMADSSAETRNVYGLRTLFGSAWSRTCVDTPGGLVIGGGCPSIFDGTYVWEVGFAYEPDLSVLPAFTKSNAAGQLTPSKKYGYKMVYAVTDGRGNVHRSAPSLAKEVTLGVADDTVQGTCPPLQLTNRTDGTDSHPVIIEIYRTTGDGSTYYYCQSVRNDPRSVSAIAFTDGMSDTNLQSQRQLYTNGGVRARALPESAALAFTHKNAVFLGDTASGALWVSGELLEDEGVWFNEGMTVPAFEGGRVTAIASVDETLVVTKSDALFAFTGEPPNDRGSSTLSSPRRIQSDVGCIDPYSVVGSAEGLYFYGRTGLALLGRDFNVVPVGKSVEDLYSSTTQARRFAGAVLLPGQNLIRFVQYNEATAAALNLDYYHARQLGALVWTADNYYDATLGNGTPMQVAACTFWQNRFVYITASGVLMAEKTASSASAYLDTNYAGSTEQWIEMRWKTGYSKPDGPQGYHRFWDAYLLGAKGSDHTATVTLESELGTQSKTWDRVAVNGAVVGTEEQLTVHMNHLTQKVQRLSLEFADGDPGPGNRGNGKGMTVRDVRALVGVKRSRAPKLPVANRR